MSSMVIQVIDKFDIDAGKTEGEPPVSVYPYRPVTLQITLQSVQSQPRLVQVPRFLGHIEHREEQSEFLGMCRLNTPPRTGLVKGFESLMPKTDNHGSFVSRIASRYKRICASSSDYRQHKPLRESSHPVFGDDGVQLLIRGLAGDFAKFLRGKGAAQAEGLGEDRQGAIVIAGAVA